MADILFVLASLAFFGLCALYVRGCERIIGSSEDTGTSIDATTRERIDVSS